MNLPLLRVILGFNSAVSLRLECFTSRHVSVLDPTLSSCLTVSGADKWPTAERKLTILLHQRGVAIKPERLFLPLVGVFDWSV